MYFVKRSGADGVIEMVIIFRWSDSKTYEFDISEDYGGLKMFELWDAIIKNPNLGKMKNYHYTFEIKKDKESD